MIEDSRTILAVIGIALTLLLVAFRQRQLYLLMPMLHEHTPLSDDGRVVEITLLNKSWLMEEDVKVEFPLGFKIELLAANVAGILFTKGVVSISRLPQRSSLKLILLFEGQKPYAPIIPKITSKTSLGKVVTESNIPPNFGMAGLTCLGFFIFFVFFAHAIKTERERADELRKKSIESERRAESERTGNYRSLQSEIIKLDRQIEMERSKCADASNAETLRRIELSACRKNLEILELQLSIEKSRRG